MSTEEAPLKVVVAEDSVLLREGLVRLLEDSGFEVAGQAGDAEDLLRKVGAHKPDVAVIDVRMPPSHTDEGLRAARKIRADHPGTGVLVLSQYVEEAYALDLLSESTESTGYLLKDRVADVDTFTDAVRRVAGGGSALDPEVVALLLGRRRREDPLEGLTAREREVLGLMAEGRSNAAIAEALVVTERAVEKHVTSIFSKLDLAPTVVDHRRVLAVLAYLRSAWLALPRATSQPHAGRRKTDHPGAYEHRFDGGSAPDLRRGRDRRARARRRDAVLPRRPVHGDHGPVGLRQVDADAPARRARQADVGLGRRSTASELALLRRRQPHAAAPRPARVRLPGLQPRAGADRRGEHHAAADARGPRRRPGVVRQADRHRRPARPAHAPPLRALRRPAAARRGRARARPPAGGAVRRRADRQPRLARLRGGPEPAAPGGRRVRADGDHGHPRRAGGRGRRPDRDPAATARSSTTAPAPTPTACST